MTFLAALNVLCAFTITGVDVRELDELPAAINVVDMPILVMSVFDGIYKESSSPFGGENSKGFQAVAFSAGPKTVTHTAYHHLFVMEIGSATLLDIMPDTVALIDLYIAELAADVSLGGTLVEPVSVTVIPEIFSLNKRRYYGVTFRLTLVIQL